MSCFTVAYCQFERLVVRYVKLSSLCWFGGQLLKAYFGAMAPGASCHYLKFHYWRSKFFQANIERLFLNIRLKTYPDVQTWIFRSSRQPSLYKASLPDPHTIPQFPYSTLIYMLFITLTDFKDHIGRPALETY